MWRKSLIWCDSNVFNQKPTNLCVLPKLDKKTNKLNVSEEFDWNIAPQHNNKK